MNTNKISPWSDIPRWYAVSVNPMRVPPPVAGYYLLLVYEWTGRDADRSKHPKWAIWRWDGQWTRKKYFHDTGGYEWFEPVAWAELPDAGLVQEAVKAAERRLP